MVTLVPLFVSLFAAKRKRTGAMIRFNPIYNPTPNKESQDPTSLNHHVDLELTGKCWKGQITFSLICLVIIILVIFFFITFGVISLQWFQLSQQNSKTIQKTPPTKGL